VHAAGPLYPHRIRPAQIRCNHPPLFPTLSLYCKYLSSHRGALSFAHSLPNSSCATISKTTKLFRVGFAPCSSEKLERLRPKVPPLSSVNLIPTSSLPSRANRPALERPKVVSPSMSARFTTENYALRYVQARSVASFDDARNPLPRRSCGENGHAVIGPNCLASV